MYFIKLKRNSNLWVGDINVTDTPLDRTKATSSTSLNFCVRNGVFNKCTNYTASFNPFISDASDSWWMIPIDKFPTGITVNTNADIMEILDTNGNIIITKTYPNRWTNNLGGNPDYAVYGQTIIKYTGDTLSDITSISCRNKISANVQSCIKGSDDGCVGFTFPDINRSNGTTYWSQEPYRSLNLQGQSINGNLLGWKLINIQPCGYTILHNGIQVDNKTVDNCMVTYNKCIGDNCYKKPDGTLYYNEHISGCTDGVISDWSPWKCENNVSTRTRNCIPPLNGGKPCESAVLIETSDCSNAKMFEWSEWKCSNGKANRTRICVPAKNGGKPCESLVETKDCSDAKMSEWIQGNCDNGKVTRTRTCIEPVNGGKPCESLIETKDCSDAKMSEWTSWNPDLLYETRTRTCIQPVNGGKSCDTNMIEKQVSKNRVVLFVIGIILIVICTSLVSITLA